MSSEERRRYFRIDDELIFDWRVIDTQEKQRRTVQLQMNQIDFPDPDRFYLMLESDLNMVIQNLKVHNQECAKALELLNRKLNLIASSQKIGMRVHLFDKVPQKVNISACGVAFKTDQALQLGQSVLIEMLLMPQKVYIQCLGEVMACDQLDKDEYQVNVDFDVLREEDKEQLIQHIVQKEMGQLQQKRKLEGK